MITRPMLASAITSMAHLRFPLLATPKIDGIRCVTLPSRLLSGPICYPVSRNLKPIANTYVHNLLCNLPQDFDGELVCPGGFQATQTGIMTREGTPVFTYRVFDIYSSEPYSERINTLKRWCRVCPCAFVDPVFPDTVHSMDELLAFEQVALEQGYEGVMLRTADSPYKFGRSTFREHYLLKLKRFADSEAIIEDFEEKQHNDNTKITNALRLTERSHHKSGMVGCDTLGSLLVRDCKSSNKFSIGSGFDDSLRARIWRDRDRFRGKIITYKYQPSGVKDLPRFPVFKGFRPELDEQ